MSMESSQQWEKVLAQSPVGLLAQVEDAWVVSLYIHVAEFIRRVVIHRREHDVQAWRSWILKDRSSHPFWWLTADLVPPPFLSVRDVGMGREIFRTGPAGIDGELRNAWMPFLVLG